MTKINWIISSIILLCTIGSVTAFSFVYHAQSGAWFPWWAYVVVIALFAIYVAACFLFTRRRKDTFYRRLRLSHFDVQREYKWGNRIFCMDFASKRIACNLLWKSVIPFQTLAGFSMDISDRTQWRILPQNKRNVTLSISILVGDDKSLLHIGMYEVIVDLDDIGNERQVNFESLVPKYPLMKDLIAMQQDLTKIMACNS